MHYVYTLHDKPSHDYTSCLMQTWLLLQPVREKENSKSDASHYLLLHLSYRKHIFITRSVPVIDLSRPRGL